MQQLTVIFRNLTVLEIVQLQLTWLSNKHVSVIGWNENEQQINLLIKMKLNNLWPMYYVLTLALALIFYPF